MPLLNLQNFIAQDHEETVDTASEVPKEFDIFMRTESEFLPPGKTFDDLTPEELERLKGQYRFDPFKPGIPQTLSWIGQL